MAEMRYKLGDYAETSYGPSGKIMAYTDQPTYLLIEEDGTRHNVVESTITKVVEKFNPPALPEERNSVVMVETIGTRYWLAWRSHDDWDVLDPRGTAHVTKDPYAFITTESGRDIVKVTFMVADKTFGGAS